MGLGFPSLAPTHWGTRSGPRSRGKCWAGLRPRPKRLTCRKRRAPSTPCLPPRAATTCHGGAAQCWPLLIGARVGRGARPRAVPCCLCCPACRAEAEFGVIPRSVERPAPSLRLLGELLLELLEARVGREAAADAGTTAPTAPDEATPDAAAAPATPVLVGRGAQDDTHMSGVDAVTRAHAARRPHDLRARPAPTESPAPALRPATWARRNACAGPVAQCQPSGLRRRSGTRRPHGLCRPQGGRRPHGLRPP